MLAESYKAHADCYRTLVHWVHRLTVLIALVAFGGYGVALWLWFQGDWEMALILATIGYLLFRNFRRLSFGFALNRMRGSEELVCTEALALLDGLMEEHKPAVIMAALEAEVAAERDEAASRNG